MAGRVFWIVVGLLAPRVAFAQLGPDGAPLRTNDYAIDGYQGPVLASTRVIGLSGAYVALAEFTEGNTQNPAAPGVRADYSFDSIDYDIGVGVTFPGSITGTDFFNTGSKNTALPTSSQDGFVFFELSGNLQFGPWGVGLASSVQQYGLESSQGSGDTLRTQLGFYDLQLARSLWSGQIVVGLGARLGSTEVFNTNRATDTSGSIFQGIAISPEVGLLYRPNGRSYRLGFSFRAPLDSNVANSASTENVLYPGTSQELYLPGRVSIPWELALGASYRFGRVLNPEWLDPAELTHSLREEHTRRKRRREARLEEARQLAQSGDPEARAAFLALDAILADETARDDAELRRVERETRQFLKERYARMTRRYLLVSAAFFVNGAVEDGVGMESFLERTVNRSGQTATVSPRLGLETEVIPYWLILRAGTYYEPTRFESNPYGGRLHGTLGADFRLGQWNVFGAWPDSYVWRLRTSIDVSRNYFNWGFAIGGFY